MKPATEAMFQRRRQVLEGTSVVIQYSSFDLEKRESGDWYGGQARFNFFDGRKLDIVGGCEFVKVN